MTQPTIEANSYSLKGYKISSASEDAGYMWNEKQAHHSIVGGVPTLN